MMSVRMRGLLFSVVPLAASLAVAAAGGPANAAGGNPPVNNPPAGGPSYSATVAERIILSGHINGQGYNGAYIPPDCWLQPDFHQPQSYQAGDPQPGPADADSYYFWFGRHYPGFNGLIHGTGGPGQINQDFQMVQQGQNDVPGGPNPVTKDFVWWAPNWLSSPAGWACAQGLTANLNNGFIDLEPPAKPGAGGAAGQITGQQLAALARAALALPGIKIVTSPPATGGVSTSYVNLPTYVSVVFQGAEQPFDQATVTMADGTNYLTATITTTKPTVSITTTAPANVSVPPASTCAATKAGTATPACSVKFLAPSSPAAPYTITVTATWVVHWTTSADPAGGIFRNPPSVVTAQQNFVIKEIQSVNNG